MGKGPGTIYKDCLALARKEDGALLDIKGTDIQKEINTDTGFCTLFEKDIRLIFFKQNYSERSTDRALKQWAELDLTQPYTYKGYKVLLFLESNSKNKRGGQ